MLMKYIKYYIIIFDILYMDEEVLVYPLSCHSKDPDNALCPRTEIPNLIICSHE